MLQLLFDILTEIGDVGLFIAMFFKGSTIPLPSLVFIISYGYLLNPGPKEMAVLAIGMSLTFTLASYLPYGIGYRLEKKIQQRYGNKIAKARYWFQRYGEWSVCFTRPFTIGMYISYVAGIGKVNVWKYGVLTFLGILPWSFFILYLSKAFQGNLTAVSQYIKNYIVPVAIVLMITVGFYLLFIKVRRKRNDNESK